MCPTLEGGFPLTNIKTYFDATLLACSPYRSTILRGFIPSKSLFIYVCIQRTHRRIYLYLFERVRVEANVMGDFWA
jgi:hypothetical protein